MTFLEIVLTVFSTEIFFININKFVSQSHDSTMISEHTNLLFEERRYFKNGHNTVS